MALYFGSSSKQKIILNNSQVRLNIPTSSSPASGGIVLMSLDNYMLKDSNGLYLTAKEDN